MTREELRRRAVAMGVMVTYGDGYGREVEVPDETLAAIVEALAGTPPPDPEKAASQVTGLNPPTSRTVTQGTPLNSAAPFPERRSWGFAVQLYSLRSRGSWGHGDLRDLADFAAWSARGPGAGFVLINPLHAAEPLPPVSPSPYLPMSRRFISPLYLRIEDIPEYSALRSAQRAAVDALGEPLRAASGTAALIDRDAVWTAKRAALEIIHRVPLVPRRLAALDEFRKRRGRALYDWATWCAIAEMYGPDWRAWPAALADPRSAAVSVLRGDLADRIAFHVWLQWLAADQAAEAQRAARLAGMDIGVVHDLAVGSHPGGADAWADQDIFVRGVSVGAPPDEFNPRGQDWTLPPSHPGHLAGQGYRPLAALIAAAADGAGGLRIDHVMGLARLWWIPAGMSPDRGAYVRYDHEMALGTLAAEADRAQAVAIGEDLGTVEPSLRDYLAARRVLGMSVLWFERGTDGAPLPPAEWRNACLATVSTHDMPPAAAFLTGEQVTERARLGVLTRPEAAERADAEKALSALLAALAREGLITEGERPDAEQFTAALYGYLARTPAVLIGVSLAEAVGERRAQNVPGTTHEYPNWRLPLCGPDGAPVLLEDLPANSFVRTVVAAVTTETARTR
ncbi:MAG: 4-alpha-glucanotransferase [Streptosporangiaceae bacterium]|nr:4-alpha-glucanotransferase [Streptosporangiaceae bacterium]